MCIPTGGIAFFDSGIGGLTVLDACKKLLPTENFYYYGDNLRAPYGNLSVDIIRDYVFEAFEVFQSLSVAAAVIACNTVTAVCIDELRQYYHFPIIGTEPAVLPAVKDTKGEAFVLTTRATYQSERFQSLCARAKKEHPFVRLRLCPCDDLAGEIERRIEDGDADFTELLPSGNPLAVVLGCTHYVYIKEQIKNYYRCPVYDGNHGIALRLGSLLEQNRNENIKNRERKPPGSLFMGDCIQTTTVDPLQQKEMKANKCSWSSLPNTTKTSGQIFFIGSGKMRNKTIYERMFAF